MSNPSIKYGVYAGIIMIVIDLILYLVNEKLFIMANSYFALPIIIGAMIYSAKDYKTANDGFGSFRELFTASWLSYLIAGIIATLFSYVLYNFIAPGLIETTMQVTAEGLEKAKGMMSEEMYEKAMEQLESQETQMGVFSMMFGLLVKYAFAAIPAMIIAAVMKKVADPFA